MDFRRIAGQCAPDEAVFEQAAPRLIACIWEHFSAERAIKMYKKAAMYMAANFLFGHSIWPELTRGDDRTAMEANARRIPARGPGGAYSQRVSLDGLRGMMDAIAVEWGLAGLLVASFLSATILPGASEVVLVGVLAGGSAPFWGGAWPPWAIPWALTTWALGRWGSAAVLTRLLPRARTGISTGRTSSLPVMGRGLLAAGAAGC